MMKIKKLNDFNFKGKIAIIRVDFNVPLDKNLRITDFKNTNYPISGFNELKQAFSKPL